MLKRQELQHGEMPLISIVTVVRNGEEGIRSTIQSVIGQHNCNLEYIIVDGGSTDGTLGIIREYDHDIDYWVSEPDQGIYDAMNKAIECCSGKYILFLNAKDELAADLGRLIDIFNQDHVFIYGKANIIGVNGKLIFVKGKEIRTINKLIRGTPLCHQAILFRRDFIGKYDISYKVIADRVLTYELVKNFGISRTCFVDTVISNYFEGGYSRQNIERWSQEEYHFLKSVGKRYYAVYKRVGFYYKKYLKGRIASSLHSCFCRVTTKSGSTGQ